MRHSKLSYVIAWVSLISLVCQFGCSSSIPILPKESREKLGTIALVSVKSPPEINLQEPDKGRLSGAGKGAAKGAVTGIVAPLHVLGSGNCGGSFCGLILLLVAAASVAGGAIGGVVGGISGAVQAKPVAEDAEVKETEQKVQHALANLNMQETLKYKLLKVAQERTNYSFVNMSGQGAEIHQEKKNYSELKSKGIDSVLETDVVNFGLIYERHDNPTWHFFLDTRVRLISVGDGKDLYNCMFRYTSLFGMTFSEWCDVDAKRFNFYLDFAYQNLSERIVDYLLLSPTVIDSEQKKSVFEDSNQQAPFCR